MNTGTRLVLTALVASVAAQGCSHTAQFVVTRPALINVAQGGGGVSVGTIDANGDPEASADLTAQLLTLIQGSINPNIHVGPGGVVIDGRDDSRYDEVTVQVPQTCTQQVQEGVHEDGSPRMRSETYDCSYTEVDAIATSDVVLRVKDAATHKLLFKKHYSGRQSATNPGPTAKDKMLHDLRVQAVDAFAHVILPWQETVTERFKTCEGDDNCKAGLKLVGTGELAAAELAFTQAIGKYATGPVPEKDARQIGEAFYNRGVTRAYLARFPEALADLARAVELQPARMHWRTELTNVRGLQSDHEALVQQGTPSEAVPAVLHQ